MESKREEMEKYLLAKFAEWLELQSDPLTHFSAYLQGYRQRMSDEREEMADTLKRHLEYEKHKRLNI